MTSSFQCLAYLIYSSLLSFIIPKTFAWDSGPVDTTEGFVSLPLNKSYYHIQRPYDVPEDQRYSFINGVHKCWVYSTDKPHTPTSQTKPRTEIAIQVSSDHTKPLAIYIIHSLLLLCIILSSPDIMHLLLPYLLCFTCG